jgi:hypothetical protein
MHSLSPPIHMGELIKDGSSWKRESTWARAHFATAPGIHLLDGASPATPKLHRLAMADSQSSSELAVHAGGLRRGRCQDAPHGHRVRL